MHAIPVAVVPFLNLCDAPEQDYFARGFVDDLITELSRFPSLEIIGGYAVLREDAAARPSVEVARELGASFVLKGSVRKSDDTLRVNAQLVDVETGRHRWAQSFAAPLDRVFVLQDELVSSLAGALALRIDDARLQKARRTPMGGLAAYDCWLRGMDCLRRGTLEADEEARAYFQRAMEIDPHYSRAWAGMSLSYFNDWTCQAWHLWDESADKAFECALRASELDEGDPIVHLVLGRVRLYHREFDAAKRHFERALALNPNDPDLLAHIAPQLVLLGEAERAIELANEARRLNPTHPGSYEMGLLMGFFFLRTFEEAIAPGERADIAFVDTAFFVAAALAQLGDLERARPHLKTFRNEFRLKITFGREPEPGEELRWLEQVIPFRRAEDAILLRDSARRLGLEVGEHALPAARSPSPSPVLPANIPLEGDRFRLEGDVWTLAFEGTAAQLADVKGFHDLARLLARPGESVHSLELLGAPSPSAESSEQLDGKARRQIEARIRELQEDLQDAEDCHDLGRAERAREELDALVEELQKALGLRGRPRKLNDPAERARTAVTWRIRSAIKRVAAAHPRLGQHLASSVKTGTFCVYAPEVSRAWRV
jgi:TolB-like protein/tetratricopeptide (TPR) repeat protein